jgi:hypothetical protein
VSADAFALTKAAKIKHNEENRIKGISPAPNAANYLVAYTILGESATRLTKSAKAIHSSTGTDEFAPRSRREHIRGTIKRAGGFYPIVRR